MSYQYTGPYQKIVLGHDFNFFAKKIPTVTTASAFPVACDVFIPFSTQTVSFILEGTGSLEYSFNGNTVHGEMTVGASSTNLKFDNRVISKIWLRGSAGAILRIEAWALR